ncbi:hypothetical protein O1G21_02985 [Kitasatospora cathayae]|uniref:FAD-binding domain-containing protein n=1 Tax=Kitasatospora cathayae TaxID=3004092 RepID=A0ABY7QFC1_9ACTN|nr:hypothetical protein [Kitasatospora sp. HUAS 3-15]WBP91443.1 hypothetical protein O1G21_02985 [Kitasatospora sp. HUAS 3-15]
MESYETERQPVAHRTLRQAVANTRLLLQVQDRRRERRRTGEAVPVHTSGSHPTAPRSTSSANGSPCSPRTALTGSNNAPHHGRCTSRPFPTSRPTSAACARTEHCSSGPTATSAPGGATARRVTPPSATPSPQSPARHPPTVRRPAAPATADSRPPAATTRRPRCGNPEPRQNRCAGGWPRLPT